MYISLPLRREPPPYRELLHQQLLQHRQLAPTNDCHFLAQELETLVRVRLLLTAQGPLAYEELHLDVLLEVHHEALPQLVHLISGPTCGLDPASLHQRGGADGDSKGLCQERAHEWSEVGFLAGKDHDHAPHWSEMVRR